MTALNSPDKQAVSLLISFLPSAGPAELVDNRFYFLVLPLLLHSFGRQLPPGFGTSNFATWL